jgi:deazaflavin-dependent oxidoreductase (nitroreductase family)
MVKRLPTAMYRLIGFVGTSRPVTRLHPHLYRLTGGRGPLGRNFGVLNIIVYTIGRTTGKPRDVPLFAYEDGDRLVLIGSNGGDDREPSWVGNLRATPDVDVQVGRVRKAMRARETEGEERARLWALAATNYPGYELYRSMTDRRIPVVVLEPCAEAQRDSRREPRPEEVG